MATTTAVACIPQHLERASCPSPTPSSDAAYYDDYYDGVILAEDGEEGEAVGLHRQQQLPSAAAAVVFRPAPIRPQQLTLKEVEEFYSFLQEEEQGVDDEVVDAAFVEWQSKYVQYLERPANPFCDEDDDDDQATTISTISSTTCPEYRLAKRVRFLQESDADDETIASSCSVESAVSSDDDGVVAPTNNLCKPVPIRGIQRRIETSTVATSGTGSSSSSIRSGAGSTLMLPQSELEHDKKSSRGFFVTPAATAASNRPCVPLWVCRPHVERPLQSALHAARDGLLQALSSSGGDTSTPQFLSCLKTLHGIYLASGQDIRRVEHPMHGTWLTLTKPVYRNCLGTNDHGDPLYPLARMSFDMFTPGNVVCSLQGNFNAVRPIPPDVNEPSKCTYDVLTAFTVEPAGPSYPAMLNQEIIQPIRGIMSTTGHIVPDPDTPNRHSVWITAGSIQANGTEQDQAHWQSFFGRHQTTKKSLHCQATQLASAWFLGATTSCQALCQTYRFTKLPLGGHGRAWIDTLYCDRSLRIVQGHKGSIFVFTKMKSG